MTRLTDDRLTAHGAIPNMIQDHQTTIESAARREPLTEGEAAMRLGLKVATLRAWRHQRRGPAFVRLGRAIRYLASDVDAFLDANREYPSRNPPARHLANELVDKP
jgi:predicted DNA-binding transcriptional regulator AlpA